MLHHFQEECAESSEQTADGSRTDGEVTIEALGLEWIAEADAYTLKGVATEAANTLRRCANELRLRFRYEQEHTVNLQEAAAISGYTADHIGKLVRDGKVENLGRLNSPRVRVADLPRKPRRLTGGGHNPNMKSQVARGIASASRRRSNAQA